MMRAVIAALVGLLLGVFIGIDLILLGVVSIDTILVFVLGLVGLVAGGVLGRLRSSR